MFCLLHLAKQHIKAEVKCLAAVVWQYPAAVLPSAEPQSTPPASVGSVVGEVLPQSRSMN